MVQQWKQPKGQTIIYVGDGKGKTTAAIGMAVRALGHGWRVFILQFMKEDAWSSGERDFFRALMRAKKESTLLLGEGEGEVEVEVRSLGEVTIETAGAGFVGIMGDRKLKEEHRAAAQAGYERVMNIMMHPVVPEPGRGATEIYQLVVLDEILSAVDEQLLTEDQILDLMAKKPEDLTLVMTGHKFYPRIFEKADLVTEMKKLKHPFDAGYIAKKGTDY